MAERAALWYPRRSPQPAAGCALCARKRCIPKPRHLHARLAGAGLTSAHEDAGRARLPRVPGGRGPRGRSPSRRRRRRGPQSGGGAPEGQGSGCDNGPREGFYGPPIGRVLPFPLFLPTFPDCHAERPHGESAGFSPVSRVGVVGAHRPVSGGRLLDRLATGIHGQLPELERRNIRGAPGRDLREEDAYREVFQGRCGGDIIRTAPP